MGLLDRMKSMMSGNKDKVDGAIDKAGDVVDEKTGGKYTDKVDMGQDKAKEMLDKGDDQA